MEKFEKLKEEWHIEKRTKGKREHYEQPGSAFRNVSGSGRGAVSVVRSLELPPSFRGPREERGVRGETGSPGPGFDWLRWFKQDSLTSREGECARLAQPVCSRSLLPAGRWWWKWWMWQGEWSCWINLQMGTFCRNVEFMNSFQPHRPNCYSFTLRLAS